MRIADLKSRIQVGGLREALIRTLLYVGMARGAVDERGFESLRRIRRSSHKPSCANLFVQRFRWVAA